MKSRRGDIVLVLFPNSDLRTAKRRPALVPYQSAEEAAVMRSLAVENGLRNDCLQNAKDCKISGVGRK
jgi:hypothetical protein